jgi:hypothetical protein
MGCRGDAGVAGRGPLDCRVAALLAMTKGRTGMGGVGCPMRPLDCRVGALPLIAMTTGGNLRRSGFACLAWPGSALGQGPLRSASVAPRAGSALLGGSLRLTPLLAGRSETEAEAQVVGAAGPPAPVPKRGTGGPRRDAVGTTAVDAVGADRRPDRIAHCASWVIPVPVRAPLVNVSMHVVEAPLIGPVLSDVHRFVVIVSCIPRTIPIIIGLISSQVVAESISRSRTRSAGILPLGLRG